jgi:hypothetical protein
MLAPATSLVTVHQIKKTSAGKVESTKPRTPPTALVIIAAVSSPDCLSAAFESAN